MKKWLMISLFSFSSLVYSEEIYLEPPRDFAPKVEVAICFINANDEFLFLKRQSYKPEGNTWAVPGGKVDRDETPLCAVIREVSEETDLFLDKEETKYLGKVFVRAPKGDLILHIFENALENKNSIQLNPKEHQAYVWMPLEKSSTLNLIPGEDQLIDLFFS